MWVAQRQICFTQLSKATDSGSDESLDPILSPFREDKIRKCASQLSAVRDILCRACTAILGAHSQALGLFGRLQLRVAHTLVRLAGFDCSLSKEIYLYALNATSSLRLPEAVRAVRRNC